MVRVGYHYIHSVTGDTPVEHRGALEATPRYPLVGGLLVSDRNHMDIRSIGGENSWRYRNRLTLEREFSIGRFRSTPYVRGEVYYDSRFDNRKRGSSLLSADERTAACPR